jgi:hypothetical protein
MGLRDWLLGPPGKDQFARMVMDAVRDAGEKDPIRYDRKSFQLLGEGEHKGVMNLTNPYDEYCAMPKDRRPALFKNLVRSWFSARRSIPEDFEDAKPDLLPSIRSRTLFELTAMRLRSEAEKGATLNWPHRVLAESLGVCLVYDLPDSMMQIQQDHLDRWATNFDAACEVACDNLRQITRHEMERASPGVWQSPWRDNYDPSRMLLDDYIRHHAVGGDPVAMVPNRDTLLLTGADDVDGLAKMVVTAEKAFDHPRRLAGMAYRLTVDDEWAPFLPHEDHPQHAAFRLLKLKCLGADYAEQGDALNAVHEKTGKDIFVAAFSARQKEGQPVRSYCVWSEGVVAFLPETDDIFFFRPNGEGGGEIVAVAGSEQARAALGDLMKPVGIYPERYLVRGFPSDDQLAAFGLE